MLVMIWGFPRYTQHVNPIKLHKYVQCIQFHLIQYSFKHNYNPSGLTSACSVYISCHLQCRPQQPLSFSLSSTHSHRETACFKATAMSLLARLLTSSLCHPAPPRYKSPRGRLTKAEYELAHCPRYAGEASLNQAGTTPGGYVVKTNGYMDLGPTGHRANFITLY